MNKPYYSALATKSFFILGGSFEPIEVISRENYGQICSISGYYVKALFQDKGKIYVIASEKDNPDITSIYFLEPLSGSLEKLTPPLFGDARGGTAIDNLFIVADGSRNRIVVWDNKEKKITKVVEGFNYPNDITLTPRKTFLVANEHNNELLEIDFRSEKILRSSPMGELRSPGSALEIDRGRYKGYWLISDTDNDRVILVHPETWEIVFECNNLNGPLSAVPIFE